MKAASIRLGLLYETIFSALIIDCIPQILYVRTLPPGIHYGLPPTENKLLRQRGQEGSSF